MKKEKNQYARILNAFITSVVILMSVTLVAAGISISKVNTEYLTTGVRAAKIVAERENRQISLVLNDRITPITGSGSFRFADRVLSFMPPPVNTVYILCRELGLVDFRTTESTE